MGQKVHPTGIRLGIVRDWTSKWYAGSKHFADYLYTDIKVREFLKKKLAQANRAATRASPSTRPAPAW